VLTVVAIGAIKRSDRVPAFLAGPVATTASTVTAVAPAADVDTNAVRVDDADGPTGAAPERNLAIEVVRPPALPERPDRPTPVAAPPPVAIPAATSARASDDGDATVIIDWLLKGRRPGGSVSNE
jgi:hypothetical protein